MEKKLGLNSTTTTPSPTSFWDYVLGCGIQGLWSLLSDQHSTTQEKKNNNTAGTGLDF